MLLELIQRLESLERELLRLSEEAEENRRCSSNVIRLGVVTEAYKTTVDVKAGPNKATAVPFFVFCAGRVSHYRRPSVGEQCLLINLGSGDNLNNSVALMGLPSTQYPGPTTAENEFMTDYGGGMTERYNLDDGSLTMNFPGGLFLNADLTHVGNQEHTGNTNRTGDTILTGNQVSTGGFNHQGGFAVSPGTGGGSASISGGMDITDGDVIADGYSLKGHHHDDAEGRATSEAKT